MPVRTFLALDLDDRVRRLLAGAAGQFPAAAAKVRWVAPENLHVTMKFLGDVADADVDGVCRAVAAAAAASEPFDFEVRGLRCVPPGGALRMIWAEVADPSGRMAELAGAMDAALQPLGFAPERRGFHPHITLARIGPSKNPREVRAAAARQAGTPFGAMHAEQVVVYRSELTPRGPIYTPMAAGRLGTA